MARGRTARVGRWMMRAPGNVGRAIARGAANLGNALRVLGRTGNAPGGGGGGAGGAPAGSTPMPNQGQIDAALTALTNTPDTFLQNNVVQTGGQKVNGQLPASFHPMPGAVPGTQEMRGGKPVWQLERPPAGQPGNTDAYNFKLTPMSDVLDQHDSPKADPAFLTIPADAADGLVYTGQLTGCTIAAITMPDGSVQLVHLQPRKTAERPAPPPGTSQQDAENQAMQDVVNAYMAKVGGTGVVFYQSGTASTPTTYPKNQLRGVYISGHVKNGVLHLFAQEIPMNAAQPIVVKEIFTIDLG